jgi:ADP-ribosylation factor GTPase-activating protein 2/3
MEQPSKQQSQQLLTRLKSKSTANKVSYIFERSLLTRRFVLTVEQKIQHGVLFLLEFISVSIVALYTETSVYTSRLLGTYISSYRAYNRSTNLDTWTWDQLRIMKVGGNASATDFFSKNGGAAALNSRDAKVKYTSRAAIAYKDELKRRSANDAKVHPNTVDADDTGSADQEKRKSEDFFESWDKPIVHKPTPPPSRTATPPVLGRTPSPANGTANGKPTTTAKSSSLSAEPAVPRTTTSSALRSAKTTSNTGARRTGVLGAKKPQKLAVKKVTEAISFEDAEKAAKEEAERIQKWGADEVELKKPDSIKPSPISVSAPVSKTTTPSQKDSSQDVARLGMGMQRLGFGMVANAPKAASGPVRSATGNRIS